MGDNEAQDPVFAEKFQPFFDEWDVNVNVTNSGGPILGLDVGRFRRGPFFELLDADVGGISDYSLELASSKNGPEAISHIRPLEWIQSFGIVFFIELCLHGCEAAYKAVPAPDILL